MKSNHVTSMALRIMARIERDGTIHRSAIEEEITAGLAVAQAPTWAGADWANQKEISRHLHEVVNTQLDQYLLHEVSENFHRIFSPVRPTPPPKDAPHVAHSASSAGPRIPDPR